MEGRRERICVVKTGKVEMVRAKQRKTEVERKGSLRKRWRRETGLRGGEGGRMREEEGVGGLGDEGLRAEEAEERRRRR